MLIELTLFYVSGSTYSIEILKTNITPRVRKATGRD